LKKDTSQIGINAREAVKFLDRVTSGNDAITLQGPEEEYMTWKEVEKHLVKEDPEPENEAEACDSTPAVSQKCMVAEEVATEKAPESAGNPLSQMLLSKLNFAKDPDTVSASSTPPGSPSSSGPQSSKTSPEVKSVKLAEHEASIVPPVLKPLLNSVIWYTYQKLSDAKVSDVIFLTNAAETASLARNFGIMPKNIHQLRALIGLEEQELKNHSKYEKKHASPSLAIVANTEADPKPLFRYEEDEEEEKDDSDEEVVVFKPRGPGMAITVHRSQHSARLARPRRRNQRSQSRQSTLILSTVAALAEVVSRLPTRHLTYLDSFKGFVVEHPTGAIFRLPVRAEAASRQPVPVVVASTVELHVFSIVAPFVEEAGCLYHS
jgi:hypothetical protein